MLSCKELLQAALRLEELLGTALSCKERIEATYDEPVTSLPLTFLMMSPTCREEYLSEGED